MAQAGAGGVGVADGQTNGTAAQPIVQNVAAAAVVQANGVPQQITVGNVAPAAPVVGPPAAVVAAAAPVAAMLAGPVIPNLAVPPVGVPPRFDVDTAFEGYEIHPWLGEEEP
jgi:hypothetical protein